MLFQVLLGLYGTRVPVTKGALSTYFSVFDAYPSFYVYTIKLSRMLTNTFFKPRLA
jgi:hypothetical protein